MGRDLRGKALMRRIVFRNDQQAAGVLINAVHDARPVFAVDAGQAVPAVIHQCIDQRAAPVSRRGMHDHAARLVDHNDVAVLEHNVQRNVFRNDIHLAQVGQTDRDLLASIQFVILFQRFTVRGNRLLRQQILGSRPRQPFNLLRQPAVDPLAGVLRCSRQLQFIAFVQARPSPIPVGHCCSHFPAVCPCAGT